MKGKLLLLWLVILTSCAFGQTWVRQLEWEDLVPAWEHNPDAYAYNVIPAVDGGYIMHGVVTIHNYVDEYTNVFWKVTQSGEVVWRNDQPTFDNTPMTCFVSNGVDKYYGLSSEYHRNILYTYDAQLNPINSIMIDTLLTNGEDIQLMTMISVDDGLVFCGRNNSEPFLLKFDYGLNVIWARSYTNLVSDCFIGLKHNQDGGYVASGLRNLIRTNPAGDTLWTYSVASQTTGFASPVYIINNNFTLLVVDDEGVSIINFDMSGQFLDEYTLILPGSSSGGISMIGTQDGNIAMMRFLTQYDHLPYESLGLLHKFSNTGEVLWSNVFLPVNPSVWEYHTGGLGINPLFIDDVGFFVLCADDMKIIRADQNGNAVLNSDQFVPNHQSVSSLIFPNPSKGEISIRTKPILGGKLLILSVFNLKGQKLFTRKIIHDGTKVSINVREECQLTNWKGTFLYHLSDGDRLVSSGKFTLN